MPQSRTSAPTREERRLAKELAAEHPWRLTYGEFLRRVSEHGYEVLGEEVRDPDGRPVQLPYLRNRSTGRIVHLPGNLEPDDVLDEFVTASLLRRIGIPAEDWGLDPQPDED